MLIVRQVFFVATPPPEQPDAVLDGVDGVTDDGKDDEKDDDDDGDDDVAFDHFEERGGYGGRLRRRRGSRGLWRVWRRRWIEKR